MIHEMRSHNGPFESIKRGNKTKELRLYDEKRQLIKKNDIIEFENRVTLEKIKVKVLNYINIIVLKNYINNLTKYLFDIKKTKNQILKIWKNIILLKNKLSMELLEERFL